MYLVPGTGFMAIGGAATQGLARVGLKEHFNDPVCVTEVSGLILPALVKHKDNNFL